MSLASLLQALVQPLSSQFSIKATGKNGTNATTVNGQPVQSLLGQTLNVPQPGGSQGGFLITQSGLVVDVNPNAPLTVTPPNNVTQGAKA